MGQKSHAQQSKLESADSTTHLPLLPAPIQSEKKKK